MNKLESLREMSVVVADTGDSRRSAATSSTRNPPAASLAQAE